MSPIKSVMNVCSRRRFTVLLAALLLLNAVRMATFGYLADRLILDVLGAVFLIAATLSLCVARHSRAVALALGIPATALSLFGNRLSGSLEHVVSIAARISSMLFLAFTIAIILQTLMTQHTVTRDSIAGAFCGYVLIGVMFSEAFWVIETIFPDSFQMISAKPGWTNDSLRRWMVLEYFSFTTLTTLGLGDVVPISPVARCLAVWEAICGQFYLAVLVAGLVNLRASRSTTESV